MTAVVSQTIKMRDLVEIILATTGKDGQRVQELLKRGAVVQGASRFRWQSLVARDEDLDSVLRTFPDADPSRQFCAEHCIAARIHAGRQTIELPREVAAERRFLKRHTFWGELIAVASRSPLVYLDYSYRTRTDEYRASLTLDDVKALQKAAPLLRHSSLIAQVQQSALESVDYLVRYPADEQR